MVDRYKIRIVPADEQTLAVMRECHQSNRWTEKNKHIREHMLAYAIAQLPRSYWYYKIDNLQDDNAIATVKKYCKHITKFVTQKQLGLVIYGPTGTGKTMLAVHIGKHAVSNNLSTWFWSNQRFTTDCLQAMKDEEMAFRVNAIIERPKLLIIDDVTHNWAKGILRVMENRLEDILRRRQSIGATILTSRRPPDDFKDPLCSLAQELMAPVPMSGIDMRKNVGQSKFDSVLDNG